MPLAGGRGGGRGRPCDLSEHEQLAEMREKTGGSTVKALKHPYSNGLVTRCRSFGFGWQPSARDQPPQPV